MDFLRKLSLMSELTIPMWYKLDCIASVRFIGRKGQDVPKPGWSLQAAWARVHEGEILDVTSSKS